MPTTIPEQRLLVDASDREIIASLAKRFNSVKIIGTLKKEMGIPALDSKRWQELLEDRKSQAQKAGISVQMVEEIFEIIHKYALEEESKLEIIR
ncbi:MAG: chorismate mutase [bacterium]